jgi:F0F1-type ATP synthase membrane subunit b/b'
VSRNTRSVLRPVLRIAAFISASSLFLAMPALSQESGPALENTPVGWTFRWIDFAIVLFALVYFFAKVAAPSLRSRSDEISQKIAEGARAREAAEKQRREVREKVANIDKDVAILRTDAKRGAEAEAVRLKALAKQEAETIERAAQAEIFAAERAAQLELKSLAARLAVERAGAMLRSEMTPEAQSSLFRTFVAELERSAN